MAESDDHPSEHDILLAEVDTFYADLIWETKRNSVTNALCFFNFMNSKLVADSRIKGRVERIFMLVLKQFAEIFGDKPSEEPMEWTNPKEERMKLRKQRLFKKIKRNKKKKDKKGKKKKGKNKGQARLLREEMEQPNTLLNSNTQKTETSPNANLLEVEQAVSSSKQAGNYQSDMQVYSARADTSQQSESALFAQPETKKPPEQVLLTHSRVQLSNGPQQRPVMRLVDDHIRVDPEDKCIKCHEQIDYSKEPVLLYVKTLDKSFRNFLSQKYLKEVSRMGPSGGRTKSGSNKRPVPALRTQNTSQLLEFDDKQ